MTTPAERIAHARAMLAAAGISEADAALDAEVLARHALSWDRSALLTRGRDPSPPGFERAFDELIARRVRREPVAQIIREREFWGRPFEVTRDVLVPRPETELIVEEALDFAREHACRRVLDVGTGSGCIAISVALELQGAHITATDSSQAALDVARRNAHRHGVFDRLSFVATDLLDDVEGPFDLIASNPPYVPEGDAANLQPEVIGYEPHAALFAGADGLAIIRRLLRQTPSRLASGGCLILEFGAGQEEAVRRAAKEAGWTRLRILTDLQGIPRTAVFNAH